MNLQKNYELRLAAQEIGDALIKISAHQALLRNLHGLHKTRTIDARNWLEHL